MKNNNVIAQMHMHFGIFRTTLGNRDKISMMVSETLETHSIAALFAHC